MLVLFVLFFFKDFWLVDLFPLHRSSPPIYGVYGQLYDTLTANTF